MIDRLVRDCNAPNWDSYGADPVDPKSAEMAHKVADVIGATWAVPTTDGGIAFEWDVEGGSYMVEVTFIHD